MEHSAREARLWRVLGMAFVAGGTIPLLLEVLPFSRIGLGDADALAFGAWCSLVILIGVAGLIAARVVDALYGVVSERFESLWTTAGWLALPIGAGIFDFQWERSASASASLTTKATLIAGAFIFLTGLLTLVGERIVESIQTRAIRRALDGLDSKVPAEGPTVN